MKRSPLIFMACLFISSSCVSSGKVSEENIKNDLTDAARSINSFYDVDINGCLQRVLIQSENVVDNPLLLYLHGGPGSSLIMYSHFYLEKLKANFIFVNWDQRGTGFSYHEGMDPTRISEGQIMDDAIELIQYLLKIFHKNKLYLIGHSFGSALGISLVAKHPEYFYAYIGVGQVIDYNRSVKITYDWLHDKLTKAKDVEGLKRIEKDNFPYIDLVTKYGGHHRLSIDLASIMKASPYYYDGYLDLFNKARSFSQEWVGKNPAAFLYGSSISKIDVPLYFFEGMNDHVIACAPELVVEYCKAVRAPKKKIVWFTNSAHLINLEEPAKFQNTLIKTLKENGQRP